MASYAQIPFKTDVHDANYSRGKKFEAAFKDKTFSEDILNIFAENKEEAKYDLLDKETGMPNTDYNVWKEAMEKAAQEGDDGIFLEFISNDGKYREIIYDSDGDGYVNMAVGFDRDDNVKNSEYEIAQLEFYNKFGKMSFDDENVHFVGDFANAAFSNPIEDE